MQWPIIPIKNLTSLFPLIFLSKHISLHALGRLKWVLDIIWPLNQHFNLKNQRNWIKQVLMLSFLIGIICILLHWPKKLTLTWYHYSHSDEERRFMYKINQGHLTVFCIVFVWLGGPPSPVRIMTQVPWFMYQNRLGPSGGIYHPNFVPCFVYHQLNIQEGVNYII